MVAESGQGCCVLSPFQKGRGLGEMGEKGENDFAFPPESKEEGLTLRVQCQ